LAQPHEGYRTVTTLFDGDADTLIHEECHNWFEQLLKFEKHPAAPDDFKALVQKARNWTCMTETDVALQLSRAGVRLAEVLNKALGKQVAGDPRVR
jgi:hypothetical protein